MIESPELKPSPGGRSRACAVAALCDFRGMRDIRKFAKPSNVGPFTTLHSQFTQITSKVNKQLLVCWLWHCEFSSAHRSFLLDDEIWLVMKNDSSHELSCLGKSLHHAREVKNAERFRAGEKVLLENQFNPCFHVVLDVCWCRNRRIDEHKKREIKERCFPLFTSCHMILAVHRRVTFLSTSLFDENIVNKLETMKTRNCALKKNRGGKENPPHINLHSRKWLMLM